MNIEDTTIALAGIFQSADLVRQLAWHGLFDQAQFEVSIQSILRIDAESAADVYGELSGVETGLQVLIGHLGMTKQRSVEVMQYVLGLIILERKLSKRKDMLAYLKTGIESTQAQAEMYAVTHPNVIVHLANLYTQTLSTLEYRIEVKGERRFLENQVNADKVRALLLAGVRSAVLWRQKGGKRWQFIFSRKKILHVAHQHLEHLKKSP